jgi:hypothetical protein
MDAMLVNKNEASLKVRHELTTWGSAFLAGSLCWHVHPGLIEKRETEKKKSRESNKHQL